MTTLADTPVPILQHEAEFTQLLQLYRQRKPQRVLEVGTYHGGTLYHWLRNAPPRCVVVSVDHHVNADNTRLYPGWTPPDVTLHVINGDSTDDETIHRANTYAPYDWIFIDADHYLINVRSDWEHYSPMAAHGAIVALHDITPTSDPTIEVDQLWRQIEHDNLWTSQTIAEPGGYGIGLVFISEAPQ